MARSKDELFKEMIQDPSFERLVEEEKATEYYEQMAEEQKAEFDQEQENVGK